MAGRSSASHRSALSVLKGPDGQAVLDGLASLSRRAAAAAAATASTSTSGGGGFSGTGMLVGEGSATEGDVTAASAALAAADGSGATAAAAAASPLEATASALENEEAPPPLSPLAALSPQAQPPPPAGQPPSLRRTGSAAATAEKLQALAAQQLDISIESDVEPAPSASVRAAFAPASSAGTSVFAFAALSEPEGSPATLLSSPTASVSALSPPLSSPLPPPSLVPTPPPPPPPRLATAAMRFLSALSSLWHRLGRSQYGTELQMLLPLSLPIMLQSTLGQLINIIDLVFIGHVLGPELLAAAALGNMVFGLSSAFYMGAASAVDSACAEAFERGHAGHVGVLGQRGMCVLLIAAFFSSIVMLLTGPLLADTLGMAPDLSATAAGFVSALLMGLVPHVASIGLARILWAQGVVWAPILVDVIANVLNVSMNAALIEVDGFLGAPLATSLSRVVQLLLLLLYLWRFKPHVTRGTWRGWQPRAALGDLGGLSAMTRAAMVGALVCAAESFPLELSNVVAGRIDVPSLDAHTALLNTCLFVSLGLPLGMSVAAAARLPVLLEAGDVAGAQRTALVAGGVTLAYNGVCALLLLLARWRLGALFTDSLEVAQQCVAAAGAAAVFTVFDGSAAVLGGVLRGLGYERVVTAINFAGAAFVGLPAAYAFGVDLRYGTVGLWLGLVGGSATCFVSYAALLSTVDWHSVVGSRRAARDRAAAAVRDGGGVDSSVAVLSDGVAAPAAASDELGAGEKGRLVGR